MPYEDTYIIRTDLMVRHVVVVVDDDDDDEVVSVRGRAPPDGVRARKQSCSAGLSAKSKKAT
jgi:hypothetical protein